MAINGTYLTATIAAGLKSNTPPDLGYLFSPSDSDSDSKSDDGEIHSDVDSPAGAPSAGRRNSDGTGEKNLSHRSSFRQFARRHVQFYFIFLFPSKVLFFPFQRERKTCNWLRYNTGDSSKQRKRTRSTSYVKATSTR